MLKLTNVYYRYDEKPLLNGINLSVGEHEVVGLLGPSGSGKSTILRIIAGLVKPLSGEIRWNDLNLSEVPAHKRNFGLMFQDYALFPHQNVYENIAFGLKMQRLPKAAIHKRVELCLKQVGMLSFADRKVTELSGGEQQRVALARAIAPKPGLLMLDEPLGALDHTLRITLLEELRSILGENGIPAIYVTHDQEEAFFLADKVALLNQGIIIQFGEPDKVYRNPESLWAANFFGLNNILDGEDTGEGSVRILFPHTEYNFTLPTHIPSKRGQLVHVFFQDGVINQELHEYVNYLNGTVIQNIFRGYEYELKILIEEKKEFTFHSIKSFPINQKVKIGYRNENLHFFL